MALLADEWPVDWFQCTIAIDGIEELTPLSEVKTIILKTRGYASIVVDAKGPKGYFLHQDFWFAFTYKKEQLQLKEIIKPLRVFKTEESCFSAVEQLLEENIPFAIVKHFDKNARVFCQEKARILCLQHIHQSQVKIANLENQLKSRNSLLDLASHDLRSPLGVITICCDFLLSQNEVEQNLTEDQLDFVKRIALNSERALGLIKDLLDIGRLGSGFHLEFSKVSFREYVQPIIRSCSILAAKRNIEILTDIKEDIYLSIDPKRFEQIIDNFVGNAIKFSPDKSTITVAAKKEIRDGQDYAIISITDQGVGIPAEKLNSIFEKYTQIDNIQASKELGVGLGLTIAQEFARLHGAKIEVSSSLGKGSSFSIIMPIQEDKKQKTASKKSILVVDDDAEILSFIAESLEDEGYNVSIARDGAEALKVERLLRPDLIFSDIRMPNMDGVELLQSIKSRNLKTKFILASGYYETMSDDLAKSVFKADAFLSKPFDLDNLIKIIDECLITSQ